MDSLAAIVVLSYSLFCRVYFVCLFKLYPFGDISVW